MHHQNDLMIGKSVSTLNKAIVGIHDGATITIGDFGPTSQLTFLTDALINQDARNLAIVNNNAGNGEVGLVALLKIGRVRKMICSFPRQVDSQISDGLYRRGKMGLELVPQGNLAARIQATGAGLGAVFTPTGCSTPLTEGKGTWEIDGRHYVLEYLIRANLALIKAHQGDRWGNLAYRKAVHSFDPIMTTVAKTIIVKVLQPVPLGGLDPEHIITPGVFTQRVFSLGDLTIT